jgi:pyruvate,water dikinase
MTYVLDARAGADRSRLGGKAASLAALGQAGVPIPAWFVVSPEAFEASGGADGADWRVLRLAEPVAAEVRAALAALVPDGGRLAVRSSAIDEDGTEHSFAGQLESYLHVPVEEVAGRIVDVWRSGFSERVVAYRTEAGLSPRPRAPAVLVQRMVASDRAGVAFSADPIGGRRDLAVISAVPGLGTALVSGEADADTWKLDGLNQVVEVTLAEKKVAHRFAPDAPGYVRTGRLEGEAATAPALAPDEVTQVADLARAAARFFGRPQDIEWAFEKGRLYLLQSRAITTLKGLPDPAGEHVIWDNSNIAESYGGITTPLTFSFARGAYASVYREFCRILGVPASVIAEHDTLFGRMLGLIRGRVYYNLLSWYRMLALLPGFTVNRRFMEQMMGVKEGLPEAIVAQLAGGGRAARAKDALRLTTTLIGLVVNLLLLPRNIRRFYARLEKALDSTAALSRLRADELAACYRDLERQLLTRWDAPLVNDFFAMIFYGVLRKLCVGWCGEGADGLQNDLISGEGGIISAEPPRRVREMATLAAVDEPFAQLLREGEVSAALQEIAQRPEFDLLWRAYLAKFGDRCLDELKLESASLHDDPTLLLRSIGHLAARIRAGGVPAVGEGEGRIRAAAEARAAAALSGHPLRREIFVRVLRQARARVRDRENLRFERTRLFGRVRRIFVELGKRFHAEDLIDSPRDIFWLEVGEVLGFVEGTTVTTDLKGLVRLRRREFEGFGMTEPPGERFETFGVVHQGNRFRAAAKPVEAQGGDLKGIGCSPGIVRGPVRIIRDPRGAVLQAGEILVAERTDPGWIMLFAVAAGILVERGSLLSHAAIVAREMGIPAVVSIPAITTALKDGDWVEFDGGSGVVRRLDGIREAGQEEAA